MQHSNIDSELRPAIEQLKAVLGESTCFDLNNLDAARSLSSAMAEAGIASVPPRPNVTIDTTVIHDAELNIDVELQIYQNDTSKDNQPVILFIHGGGYVFGAAHHAQVNLSKWCDDLGVTIASVEYRLAPEHPFPAGLHDCFAALKWLARNGGNLNIDTQRLVIVGDSAGAGLAAGLSLYAKDHSDINISLQLLMWPMIDHTNIEPANASEPIKILWNQANNKFAWNAYLKSGVNDDMLKYAAPLSTSDLSGLPNTFIGIGDQDLFFEENSKFVTLLENCNVKVDLKRYKGAFHGFAVVNPNAAISRQFNDDISQVLREHLF